MNSKKWNLFLYVKEVNSVHWLLTALMPDAILETPNTNNSFFFSAYHPFNTDFSTNLTSAALLNKTFYLMCSAEANPAADYRLYKEDKSVANITAGSKSIGVYSTSVSDRVNQVVYKCIPFNSFGDGPTKILNVPVHCKCVQMLP